MCLFNTETKITQKKSYFVKRLNKDYYYWYDKNTYLEKKTSDGHIKRVGQLVGPNCPEKFKTGQDLGFFSLFFIGNR